MRLSSEPHETSLNIHECVQRQVGEGLKEGAFALAKAHYVRCLRANADDLPIFLGQFGWFEPSKLVPTV